VEAASEPDPEPAVFDVEPPAEPSHEPTFVGEPEQSESAPESAVPSIDERAI
jgi:hypothetical protein